MSDANTSFNSGDERTRKRRILQRGVHTWATPLERDTVVPASSWMNCMLDVGSHSQ